MKSNLKEEIKVFAWCMFMLGMAFVVAASVLSVYFKYDTSHIAPDTAVTEEEEEKQTLTMESSKVSNSSAPSKPSLHHDEQVTVEDDAPKLTYIGTFIVTAYCPCEKCCGKWADGITSTGTVATQGRTIAVDPRVIPYGTVLYFEGHGGNFGGYIAEDCGGSIKGNRIDLFFDSHDEANEWGIKTRDIYIIE